MNLNAPSPVDPGCPQPSEPDVSRRRFLIGVTAVAGGFALGIVPSSAAADPSGPGSAGSAVAGGAQALTDWIRITDDDVVTVVVSQAEMGQGISTTLPAILCDELGADWPRVRFELAPTAEAYRNPRIRWQFTGNSESTASFAALMRKMGASVREMLCAVAAGRWGVAAGECVAVGGRVVHTASGRAFRFGDLARDAARQSPRADPALRPDGDLRLIGRSLARVDVPAKTDGSAQFGIDFVPEGLAGLAFAAMRTAPAYGAKPLSVRNIDSLRARPGVIDVVLLPSAVAVVAAKYWQARAALAAADIEFDAGPRASLSSATLRGLYRERLASGPVKTVKDTVPSASTQGGFEAIYELPFQSHSPLEPMNAIAQVEPGRAVVWAPTQGQEQARYTIAAVLKLDPAAVSIHRTPYLGGGFGRRLLPDFCVDAALLSQATRRPVKLIWSREEDMRRDHFRPATLHRLRASVDPKGMPQALEQRLVSPTILKPVFPPLDLSQGVDPSALEGTLETRYRIPGWRTEFHLLDIPVPTSVYRTTGFGPNIFALESFVDELARRAKQDPYRYRRALLAHDPRALRVLDEAATLSGWARPLAKGRGRGMAFTDAFGTVLAQVIEVTVRGTRVRVDRVITVADPGRVFDPKIAEAGLEGGVIWGLSAACKQEITFDRGGPVQKNFHEYDFLRMRESPVFETRLFESPGEAIGGVGEVGPVATAPALVNAIHAATGRRLRSLPFARSGFSLI